MVYTVLTVEPPVSGHPRDQKKCPFKRGARLWEVKNVVPDVAENMTKCPLTRGVRLREVSVSGGSTVPFCLIVSEGGKRFLRDGPKISSVMRDEAKISRVMRDWTSQRDA